MYRTNSHGSEILRRFVLQAESYNRCMFPQTSSQSLHKQPKKHFHEHITEQILLCQNEMNNLNLSSEIHNPSIEKTSSDEILVADIVSNGYEYETSSLDLNAIQQCCIVSITSPYAFTIQLTKHLLPSEAFFKTMNDYYNSTEDDLHIPREYLRKNLLCVSWDENVSTWNRSQIMEYDLLDDTVNIFLVDLNSWEEHVPRSRLRFILTKYSSRPVCLLTCRLASIKPVRSSEWNDVVSKTFQNVVQNCQCDVEPLYQGRDNTFYVNLFASHDEAYVCLNDFLIHCQMAKPVDDISNEKNLVYMLDENGQPMHSMIALYWKAGEAMREKEVTVKKEETGHRSSVSVESFQTKCSSSDISSTKIVIINEDEKMIFVRYNSYIMIPWFTLSLLLNGLLEEKIKTLAKRFGFKPIIINPLSHSLLYSQLLEWMPLPTSSSQISLYSIDCIRKILQMYDYRQCNIYRLLDRARLAETSDDITFWEKPYENFLDDFSSPDKKSIHEETGTFTYLR